MIKIWADRLESGYLERWQERGSTFVYTPGAAPARAVSMTMPVRLESWNTHYGLAPIFEMNLPEGALRERLRMAFAKATSSRFDNYDLLTIIGRSQLGRVRFTEDNTALDDGVPFQSVEEILAGQGGVEFYRDLLERYAPSSGISGVQPKVLVRDETSLGESFRASPSFRSATHIVKFWDENEYPQLAANEFFCLRAASKCGLEAPRFRLSQDGRALVLDRFDLRADGTYRGFEDFCVLNGRSTEEKYLGSYETGIFKRFRQFSAVEQHGAGLEALFTLLALNCALGNGDAHLKNFGLLYDQVVGEAYLAPVYDLVTTTAYIARDQMALTLEGKKTWPDSTALKRFGEVRAELEPHRIRMILERIFDAMSDTVPEIQAHMHADPAFATVGGRMLAVWQKRKG